MTLLLTLLDTSANTSWHFCQHVVYITMNIYTDICKKLIVRTKEMINLFNSKISIVPTIEIYIQSIVFHIYLCTILNLVSNQYLLCLVFSCLCGVFIPLKKGIMFFTRFVCVSVCLSVCLCVCLSVITFAVRWLDLATRC